MEKKKNAIRLAVGMLCILTGGIGGLGGCGSRMGEPKEEPGIQETSLPKAQTEESRTEESQIQQPETVPEEAAEPKTAPYVSPVDFEALWAINPDVIGWIYIEGTNIDQPILYGPDNEKYLHTDLEGNTTVAGSIFLDCEDQPDFSSLHNVLYGHHMKNGSMFKDVVYYKEQDFFDEHGTIILYTPKREIHLKPLAALYTTPDPIRRKTSFKSWKGFKAYVKEMTKDALTSAAPQGQIGRIYSLVTCSYEFKDARTILYAYEVEESGEGEAGQKTGAVESSGHEQRRDGGEKAAENAGVEQGDTADGDREGCDMESWESYWAMEEKTYRKRLKLHPAVVPKA